MPARFKFSDFPGLTDGDSCLVFIDDERMRGTWFGTVVSHAPDDDSQTHVRVVARVTGGRVESETPDAGAKPIDIEHLEYEVAPTHPRVVKALVKLRRIEEDMRRNGSRELGPHRGKRPTMIGIPAAPAPGILPIPKSGDTQRWLPLVNPDAISGGDARRNARPAVTRISVETSPDAKPDAETTAANAAAAKAAGLRPKATSSGYHGKVSD